MKTKSFAQFIIGLVCIGFIVVFTGCAGVEFSQTSPEAKDFHPSSIAVLPSTVGSYEASRDIADNMISTKLAKTQWFQNTLDARVLKERMSTEKELSDDVSTYMQKLNTLGVSDIALAQKLKASLESDALFHAYITAWEYGREEGNKVARVGVGLKLVDASTGTVVWKANHELVEDYLVAKPSLDKLFDRLLDDLLERMPH
jgi:curli biogenesis system outer membrane secretion channel CsgG